MAKKKAADKIRQLYNLSNTWTRKQWEVVNQKGYEFSHDEQLSEDERNALEDQGMPTFTINRILPVVEMLNFYATAQSPRWQAVAAEGSDTDVAAVFSDLADYIWAYSDGEALYSNAINDCITKSIGYFLISVDKDADNGMGELIIQQPEPFDIYVDPKSRDMLFRDAAFILVRKVLPKNHLIKLFPKSKVKINKASSDEQTQRTWSARAMGDKDHKLFLYNDSGEQDYAIDSAGDMDELIEFFELYEKIRVSYMNVYYRIPPNKEQIEQAKKQVDVAVKEKAKEMQVQMLEKEKQLQQALQSGQMIPERFQLEMENMQKTMQEELQMFENQSMNEIMSQMTKIENVVVSEKEFKLMMKNEEFAKTLVDNIQFYGTRIKQTCVAGDQLLYENILPETLTEYPIIPFHFKWTGTPFPVSAVSPLIGKQQEINKAHQIMVHNASLGSSLRWMYEEGSVDAELWEKYSSAPGALLPVRPGVERPTPVMPAPLSNAFYSVVQQGKQDMEYLAGIYSSMMGDTGTQHETYRGMLAMDEYGTRRIKQWMKNSIEPSLRQVGRVVKEYAQAVYTANKRFRILQPNGIMENKESEINIPVYNDLGEAIGKSMDISAAKFDVRIVSGSTLPVNRWAYLEELKQLMQLGVVDDVAVLAETDLRNKEKIVKRKSLYAQLQGQVQQLSEAVKDKEGTIETLERQLVQAGIKGKVMQAEMEITKKKEETKSNINKDYLETEAKGKLLRNVMQNEAENNKKKVSDNMKNFEKDLERDKKIANLQHKKS
jgi:hypothetical protein